MTHDAAFLLMMEELDGGLSPAGRKRLQEHLALCTDCCAEWEALRLVDGLLAGAPAMPAPAGLAVRVQEGLAVFSWRRTLEALFALSFGSLVALLLVALPAAVALLAVWMAFSQPDSFAALVLWLNRLGGAGSSILGAFWTALRLLLIEAVSSPVVLVWALAAAMAVGAWANLLGRPARVTVRNG